MLSLSADYGLVLTEVSADSNEASAVKQLAAVMLRQYVDSHWTEEAERFCGPEPPPHVSTELIKSSFTISVIITSTIFQSFNFKAQS